MKEAGNPTRAANPLKPAARQMTPMEAHHADIVRERIPQERTTSLLAAMS